ncbi:tyrosine--tRNA ligase [[Clostridium] bifermentans ATCC 638]|uniref:Tyrosine--tRNA ligase n=1 Tax=Paraclostridium bifermentans ATCC 638 = DSM 14991 TaxID=1233171 RepID=T4VQ64_PARBF|nr:tyrosine--tRNA ligase [Paraclostridium bifermentans]EQK43260.1 tyrosine--tRNA ligase [[Clostridium] bifermentans ATCC 638] [Paraclostridium bifermentans ATCC 638 = DSM 14991]RIZ60482.1 tyrosine--tRNA ligase [Paraclostridium bifermentans]UAG17125.1 tyrosine--tRNA ligase [Paraclostridium bifermentans]
MKSIDEQIRIISKGVDEIIGIEDLKNKLEKSQKENKPMVVKLGLDPSAPDIHLGHTVVLRKMKQLQDLGHKVIIIIGDFTGKIGDPTGKSKARKALSTEQVLENAKTYEEQILKVLDKEKTEIVFNSKWLSKLSFEEAISLAATTTVARMLEREDFKKRYESQTPISLHEFFYPLMQGFDSVEIKADIELGGTDQRFNVLMGRSLQKEFNQEPQVTIFMPLLEGLEGKDKMSKSLGNYIGIDEQANIMYEKAMTIPDELIIKYFELVTDIHPDIVDKIKLELEENRVNPRDIKMNLAKEIVKLYHEEEKAIEAENRFKEVFQKGQIPNDIKTVEVLKSEFDLIDELVKNKLVSSKSEVRRLITQGGVKVNNEKLDDIKNVKINDTMIVQVGKKKFIKICLK